MNRHELAAGVEYVRSILHTLHAEAETRALTDEEWTQVSEGLEYVRDAEQKLERYAQLEQLAAANSTERAEFPTFQHKRSFDAFDVIEDRTAKPSAIRDATLKVLEERVESPENMEHVERVLRRHIGPDMGSETREWAKALVLRTHDDYVSAFSKVMTGRDNDLTTEERAALSVGSNTNGGFLLPTHLDPTIIITNDGTSNVIRGISRVVTLTEGTTWNGVTSAGVTASWDGELAEVSDDSPTFGRVSIPTNVAQAFAQASIAAFQDINGLASDILMMFADARDRLESAAHATGSGSANQPTGIFTALDANTNVELSSTTAGTIGLVDIHNVYRQVPVRWRGRSTWLMHPQWALAIKELGTGVSASFSGDLREPPAGRILGRPIVECDEAPNVVTTTALDNRLIFGDFSNYVIVDKPGSMSVEFIPHLFNTANNLPDGRRGWFAYWRTGADCVNDAAFRLLQNKTSA